MFSSRSDGYLTGSWRGMEGLGRVWMIMEGLAWVWSIMKLSYKAPV
jgi:hypothetical protein